MIPAILSRFLTWFCGEYRLPYAEWKRGDILTGMEWPPRKQTMETAE